MTNKKNALFVVIVTYGSYDRFINLKKTITSVVKGGAKKIFLVNNGANYNLEKEINNISESKYIQIRTLNKNYGSLIGFKTGIKTALEDKEVNDNDYILILDDDVLLDENMLSNLRDLEKSKSLLKEKHIWSLYREGRDQTFEKNYDRSAGFYANSIAAFSVFKSRKKTRKMRKDKNIATPFFIPWAGTLILKKDFACISIPNEEYFVYEDDAAFSINVRKSGYEIYRSKKLKLKESSESWFENKGTAKSGYKLYYDDKTNPGRFLYKIRNNIFLIKHELLTNKVVFCFNIVIFVVAGFFKYGLPEKHKYLKIKELIKAIINGLRGDLGKNEKWLL
ncbi:glycosyltransferase [Pediococcus acidilactici]